jgi:hypothetical protein
MAPVRGTDYGSIDKEVHIFLKRSSFIAKKQLFASSCLSVRMEQFISHWTDFHEIRHLGIVKKICRENLILIIIGQKKRVIYMKTYLLEFFLE